MERQDTAPQASIHLPSLTPGEAIKLLLPDLGGEEKKKQCSGEPWRAEGLGVGAIHKSGQGEIMEAF